MKNKEHVWLRIWDKLIEETSNYLWFFLIYFMLERAVCSTRSYCYSVRWKTFTFESTINPSPNLCWWLDQGTKQTTRNRSRSTLSFSNKDVIICLLVLQLSTVTEDNLRSMFQSIKQSFSASQSVSAVCGQGTNINLNFTTKKGQINWMQYTLGKNLQICIKV